MRTTLDIDDEVLLAAKEHAARERRSLGSVICGLACDAPRQPPLGPGRRAAKRRGRFAVLPQRDETVTVEHVRRLQDAEGL